MSLLSEAKARLLGSPVLAPFAQSLLGAQEFAPKRDDELRMLASAPARQVFDYGQRVGVIPPTMPSTKAAAVLLVSERRIRQLTAPGGPLVAFDFGDGGAKLVTLASVESYKATAHSRGRRRRCQTGEAAGA